jgi:hypothetical protein
MIEDRPASLINKNTYLFDRWMERNSALSSLVSSAERVLAAKELSEMNNIMATSREE